jgi:hypothetical protein
MDKAEIVKKMQDRVEQCRWLARSTTDERVAQVLRQIADEGEADINRLRSEEEQTAAALPPARDSW